MTVPTCVRRQHPAEACFAATRALCNSCGKLTDAKVVFRDERVYLVKWCPEHGRSEALISSDAGWYRDSLAYVKPGTLPLARAVPRNHGCPDSCGLCVQHQQHTCVPLLEITHRCNLDCPHCLVSSGRGRGGAGGEDLSVQQVRQIMDRLLLYEGQLNMLNISGGEPTVHPDFLRIVQEVKRPEVGVVSVSTNGLALAADEDLIRALRDSGTVISLQFDGLQPETYEALRGRGDLAALKRRLVDRILELGARLSLTVNLARGINEHELEGILDLFFAEPGILSLMIQPRAHSGVGAPGPAIDPLEVLTIPDAVRLLAAGSRGRLEQRDFTPLPCSHPTCFALTYILRVDGGRPVPLPRIIETAAYLDIIKNQALLNTDTDTLLMIQDSLYQLWSSDGMIPDREPVLRTVRQILLQLNKLGVSEHGEVLDLGTRNVKSIFIHHFMDRFTFDLSRAVKCCNHYPQADGRLLPACVRNCGLLTGAKSA